MNNSELKACKPGIGHLTFFAILVCVLLFAVWIWNFIAIFYNRHSLNYEHNHERLSGKKCEGLHFTFRSKSYCIKEIDKSASIAFYCFRHTNGKLYLYQRMAFAGVVYNYVVFFKKNSFGDYAPLKNNVVELVSREFYPAARVHMRAQYPPWMGLHMTDFPNVRFMHNKKRGPYLQCTLQKNGAQK